MSEAPPFPRPVASRSRVRVPDPRPARTREAILRAAAQRFSEHGLEATTIASIAADAGVSVGSVYVHFTDKKGLWLALVDSELAVGQQLLDAAPDLGSPLQRLMGRGVSYVRFAAQCQIAFRFISCGQPADEAEHPQVGPALQRIDHMIGSIATDLEAGIASGEVRSLPARETADLIWASWNGIAERIVRQDGHGITPTDAARALDTWSQVLAVPAAA